MELQEFAPISPTQEGASPNSLQSAYDPHITPPTSVGAIGLVVRSGNSSPNAVQPMSGSSSRRPIYR